MSQRQLMIFIMCICSVIVANVLLFEGWSVATVSGVVMVFAFVLTFVQPKVRR